MEAFGARVRRARTRQVPTGARAGRPAALVPARPRHRSSGGAPSLGAKSQAAAGPSWGP
ncbi:hypothetical protein M885DRAFT_553641, partial [Pelagophyceae sp. CCMP2097]